MQYTTLGDSDLRVSRLCLGSMSWGTGNTEAEGHAQIDRALEAGVNFVDTAEMYPTYPSSKETAGRTEEIIGNWLKRTGRRDALVIATKVAGLNSACRPEGYSGDTIEGAVDGSLRRLATDVIDLYQLHWPMRPHYHFRRNWRFDPSGQDKAAIEAHMLGVLQAMGRLIEAGKIRAWGLSNETAWGTAAWLRLADANGLPRPVSIQNEYSLLCRLADTDLAELCCIEGVQILPFTPLSAGLLSAEQGPDRIPPGSRRSRQPDLNGRVTDRVWPAAAAYRDVAARHGLDVHQMALAWTLTRPFVGSTIFGASSPAQLETALGAAGLSLSQEVLDDIDAAHKAHPMPF